MSQRNISLTFLSEGREYFGAVTFCLPDFVGFFVPDDVAFIPFFFIRCLLWLFMLDL